MSDPSECWCVCCGRGIDLGEKGWQETGSDARAICGECASAQPTPLGNHCTRKQAAEMLGISTARVAVIAKRDHWAIHSVGRNCLHDLNHVQRTALKMEAQKAWRLLKIPYRLWGQPYLADMRIVHSLECPKCGETAYQPPHLTPKIGDRAACPSCQEIFVP